MCAKATYSPDFLPGGGGISIQNMALYIWSHHSRHGFIVSTYTRPLRGENTMNYSILWHWLFPHKFSWEMALETQISLVQSSHNELALNLLGDFILLKPLHPQRTILHSCHELHAIIVLPQSILYGMGMWVIIVWVGHVVIMWRVQASLSCLGLPGAAPLANVALLSLGDVFICQVGEMQAMHPQLCHCLNLDVNVTYVCLTRSPSIWNILVDANDKDNVFEQRSTWYFTKNWDDKDCVVMIVFIYGIT